MKTSNQLFLLGAFAALPFGVAAADGAMSPPDTSKWECAGCPVAPRWSGSVDASLGNVSSDSYKFGEYTGLHEHKGFFVGIGDASTRFRGPGSYYWNIDGSDLGLRSRSLDAEGGRQGKFKLILRYDELPRYLSDSARTPFAGNGGASLSLPAGFPAASTAAMPFGTLQQVELGTQRKRLALGGSWLGASNWEYAVRFSHETKEGTKRTAGAFFVNAAQLVEPVDYVTDQVDVSAAYTGGRLQAKLAYYGSRFGNGNDALRWQNPFAVPATPGAIAGQLALPPDNQFHQIAASAGYQFSDRTRGSADIAWGRMTQNQGFLSSTLNAGLAVPALAGASLDGRAATLDANLKLTSAVTKRLRLNAIYTHNERDNQTPQAGYPSVSTDMFVGVPRTNQPYSFTLDKLKLNADYRVSSLTKAAVGFDHDRRKRTFQAVDTTNEDTFWGKIGTRAMDTVDLSLKLAHGERRGSTYGTVPGILPGENPLLRKYNLANRDRDSAVLRVDFAATDTIHVGFGAESSRDDYSDSAIGLISGRDLGMNADVSWIVSEQTTVHLFANRQQIKSTQRGSQSFSTPDWSGENRDTINTVGIGVRHAAIKDKLDIGADYLVSRSRSDIRVETGASDPAFPRLSASLDSLKLYANYRLKDNWSLLGGIWHERYDSKNWMLEGVAPGTLPNILAFGEQPPRYRVNVIRLAARYRF